MPGGDEVIRNLEEWALRKKAQIVYAAKEWAGELEARAKKNAPWHDQSGNARGGLKGKTVIGHDEVIIALAHSVEYGVFLELANDGKYAILKPTLDAAIPEIYATYEKLWKDDK